MHAEERIFYWILSLPIKKKRAKKEDGLGMKNHVFLMLLFQLSKVVDFLTKRVPMVLSYLYLGKQDSVLDY